MGNCCGSKKRDEDSVFDDVLNVAPPAPDKLAVVRKYIKDYLEPEHFKSKHLNQDQIIVDFEYLMEVYRGIFFFKKMHFQEWKSKNLNERRELLKQN